MKTIVVSLADLEKCGRWRVEIFLSDANDSIGSRWPMVRIGELCEESSEAAVPPQSGHGKFVYVGLENVEPVTGDIEGDVNKPNGTVKSRSKVFRKGDVLYGRLRPKLRKALVTAELGGLCSTEFIVLKPKPEISAKVLRAILASQWVSSQLEKLQFGAALPRVSSKDLLELKVPLPDKKTQQRLEAELESLGQKRVAAKAVLAAAVDAFEDAVKSAIL